MAYVTERATDMICKRLVDYGYQYNSQNMYPALYTAYGKVAGVIQIRLNLKHGFLRTGMSDKELLLKVEQMLDLVLPKITDEEKKEKGEGNGEQQKSKRNSITR